MKFSIVIGKEKTMRKIVWAESEQAARDEYAKGFGHNDAADMVRYYNRFIGYEGTTLNVKVLRK